MLERYVYDVLAWWETQKNRAAEGQGLVEYALIIALVSIALIAALTALAGGIGNVFSTIQGALSGGGGSGQ
jgi:pilus assembly protein Flp/PilA